MLEFQKNIKTLKMMMKIFKGHHWGRPFFVHKTAKMDRLNFIFFFMRFFKICIVNNIIDTSIVKP